MKFQQRVWLWMHECFGGVVARDRVGRNHRFLEESLELVQSNGCTEAEALQLVAYVYGRPVGEPAKEVGGVMVTLAALAEASDLDMASAAEVELERISDPAFIARNRHKQATKPKDSPLPGVVPASSGALRSLEDWRNGENMAVQNQRESRVEYDNPDPHEFKDAFEKIDQ